MQHTSPVRARGKSIWLDTVPRELLDSGASSKLIDQRDVTGLSSYPTIFERVLRKGDVHGCDGWVSLTVSPQVTGAAAASLAAGA
jgi:hypothetical protein